MVWKKKMEAEVKRSEREERSFKQQKALWGFSFSTLCLSWVRAMNREQTGSIWDKQRREALCLTVTPLLFVCSHQTFTGAASTSVSICRNSELSLLKGSKAARENAHPACQHDRTVDHNWNHSSRQKNTKCCSLLYLESSSSTVPNGHKASW